MESILLLILIIVGGIIVSANINGSKKLQENEKKEILEKKKNLNKKEWEAEGCKFIEGLDLVYKGGIKNISSNGNGEIYISALEDGVGVINGVAKKVIKYDNIKDMYIDNERSIKEQVSLGKLIFFGVFAFGMKGKEREINREYIVINVVDEDGEYNVILQGYVQDENQQNYIKLKTYKGVRNIEKNKVLESSNSQESNVYNDIEELSKLKEKGILTEEEFIDKKKILLDKIK